MFRFQQQTLLVAGSSSFYVDEFHRGSGGLLFLRFSELARKFPLFGNSANADAAKLWKARGAVPISNSDYELFGVLRWDGVIEEALTRRGVPKTLAQVARGAVALAVSPLKRLNLPADVQKISFRFAPPRKSSNYRSMMPPGTHVDSRSLLHPLAVFFGTGRHDWPFCFSQPADRYSGVRCYQSAASRISRPDSHSQCP